MDYGGYDDDDDDESLGLPLQRSISLLTLSKRHVYHKYFMFRVFINPHVVRRCVDVFCMGVTI